MASIKNCLAKDGPNIVPIADILVQRTVGTTIATFHRGAPHDPRCSSCPDGRVGRLPDA